MNVWVQNYNPAHNIVISLAIVLVPIVFFFLALTVFRLQGHIAGLLTVILALIVAIVFYKMPALMAFKTAGLGFIFGLWPIFWIIFNAVLIYKLVEVSGQFNIIRDSIVNITADQRLQVLVIGFSFGAFLEGAAGFGAPVAITAGLLVGLGFNPLYAAGLCLIADSAPVAFGAIGVPVIVAAKISGQDVHAVSAMAGRQLPFLSLILPFWLMLVVDGWRGLRETWPAALICGCSFALVQFLISNYVGPELPDIVAALVSLLCTVLFLKIWHPKHIFRFDQKPVKEVIQDHNQDYNIMTIIKAWSPYLVMTVVVIIWGLPAFGRLFAPGGALHGSTLSFQISGLDNLIHKTAPIVSTPTPIRAIFDWNLLSAAGTALLFTAILSALLLRVGIRAFITLLVDTAMQLRFPMLTIGLVLALAYIFNYSGMSMTLALALAGTGAAFPFFSPILGWLGVFLTGSDTSSNALFGGLQATTAHQVGVSPVLTVAANSTGGVTGKMISPQSIAVGAAATGLVGQEFKLFRFTLKHSIIMLLIICIMTVIQAYLLPFMIP